MGDGDVLIFLETFDVFLDEKWKNHGIEAASLALGHLRLSHNEGASIGYTNLATLCNSTGSLFFNIAIGNGSVQIDIIDDF